MIRRGCMVDPVRFSREYLEFHPDATQTRVLEMGHTRGILNCSRQWGKSTVMAIKALHHALYFERANVLVVSPTERQSAELVGRAADFLRMLGERVRGDGKNKVSLMLPNRSRIVGLPGTERTIRGFTASMLLVDEAARVRDEVYEGVRPMLAVSDGELWLMSTPWGKRGFFYDEWVNGVEPWLRISAKATECPRYSAAFLEAERRKGEARFRQEYCCEFMQQDNAMFDEAQVRRCLVDDLEPLW